MSKKKYKVSREGVEVGIFDASEIIYSLRSGNLLWADDFDVEFEGVWEKCSNLGRLVTANDMECLYRLIKSHPSVSISDLVRLSRFSKRKVNYYINFFLWYGVATEAKRADNFPKSRALTDVSSCVAKAEYVEKFETINPEYEAVFLTERNINFVEGFKSRIDGEKLSALEFFVDAWVELFPSGGFDD